MGEKLLLIFIIKLWNKQNKDIREQMFRHGLLYKDNYAISTPEELAELFFKKSKEILLENNPPSDDESVEEGLDYKVTGYRIIDNAVMNDFFRSESDFERIIENLSVTRSDFESNSEEFQMLMARIESNIDEFRELQKEKLSGQINRSSSDGFKSVDGALQTDHT